MLLEIFVLVIPFCQNGYREKAMLLVLRTELLNPLNPFRFDKRSSSFRHCLRYDLKKSSIKRDFHQIGLAWIIHQGFGTAVRRRVDGWRQWRGMTGLEGCGDRFVQGQVAPAFTAGA